MLPIFYSTKPMMNAPNIHYGIRVDGSETVHTFDACRIDVVYQLNRTTPGLIVCYTGVIIIVFAKLFPLYRVIFLVHKHRRTRAVFRTTVSSIEKKLRCGTSMTVFFFAPPNTYHSRTTYEYIVHRFVWLVWDGFCANFSPYAYRFFPPTLVYIRIYRTILTRDVCRVYV